jgi:flagellar hook-associated protein 1 FlgK
MSGSFIENSDGTYVSGNNKVDVSSSRASKVDIGLFSGSSVDTLVFNDGKVSGLNQDKLDYLSTMQWNKDVDFDGTGANNTSLSDFNQALRVQVSEDKENVDFRKSTQDAVTESLQNVYDKLTKVDKDEEMMNLIKFQAAYEANAKLITMIDEMLATILGMRR